MTGAEVADRLVAAGYERGDAAGLVRGYLDATSAEVGVPVHRWGLDERDVAHIIARRPGSEDHDGAGQLDGGRVDLGALAERVARLRGAQISDQTASTNGATAETGRSDTAVDEHTDGHTDGQEWTR